jgi:Icc-related predicted phosphoesterase
MKILVVGDIHGDRKRAEEISSYAKSYAVDLVVLSGDITLFGKNHEGIVGSFVSKGLKTGIIHGNHEDLSLIEYLSELYGVTNLHGNARIYDKIGIFGCGGANVGQFKMMESEIYDTVIRAHELLEDISRDLSRKSSSESKLNNIEKINNIDIEKINNIEKKILVSHVHPSGTDFESLSKFVKGSTGLRYAIEKIEPDLVLCSHIHEAEGVEEMIGKSRVVCVGKKSRIFDL